MKFIIGLIVVVGLCLGAWQLHEYWGNFKEKEPVVTAPVVEASGQQLAGMPPGLQPTLEAAQKRGAAGLKDFLTMYGNTIQDPRRAWIELDYVVLLGQTSPGSARQKFAKVKTRVPPNSPVYPRVQELAKTYE